MSELPQPQNHAESASAPKRLHPTTLWVPLLEIAPGLLIAGIVGSYLFGILILGLLNVFLPFTVFFVIRYLCFEYQVADSELIIKSGLLHRQERRIPISKIQDVRVRRGPVHQLFGVLRLEITTAASEEREVVFDTISVAEAADLRKAISKLRQAPDAVSESLAAAPDFSLRLSIKEILLGAISSRIVSTLFAVLGALTYFQLFRSTAESIGTKWGIPGSEVPELFLFSTVEELARNFIERLPLPDNLMRLVSSIFALDSSLGGALFLILGGLTVSLAGFAARYSRFQLTREGHSVSRQYGLTTVKATTFDRNRIQAVKVEEQLLRRRFRLASVWVDSGGDRAKVDEDKNRDPLVPVSSRGSVARLMRQLLPDLKDPDPELSRVSPKAVIRGAKKGWLLLLLILLPSTPAFPWLVFASLPLFPGVYLLSLLWFRNRGYWMSRDYLISRQGWFTRQTLFLPVKNIQNVTLHQSYFDRRLGLATLSIDTAGQSNTGGGPSIPNLPLEEGQRIQRELVERVLGVGSRPPM